MREYIEVGGKFFERDDTIISGVEDFENVYFWKSFDKFKTFQLVYNEFNIRELIIYSEDEVPPGELPPYYKPKKYRWYHKLLNKIKGKI